MQAKNQFQYLNLGNQWPKFTLTNLSKEGGDLRLANVACLLGKTDSLGPSLPSIEDDLAGPAGIDLDQWGNLYIVEPTSHRILRVDACDGGSASLACLGGPGNQPGQLKNPRGLLVGPRGALYLADSGNHRIQVIDLATLQIRSIWGQPDLYAEPVPGNAPGRLNQPWDLAADRVGYLYVTDFGNQRVQKFNPDGRVIPEFWDRVQAQANVPQKPAYLASIVFREQERLLMIDHHENRLFFYNLDGDLDQQRTEKWNEHSKYISGAISALAVGEYIYIANTGGEIMVFSTDGSLMESVKIPQHKIFGLALDQCGRLLAHPGGGMPVQRWTPTNTYKEYGDFLAGPYEIDSPDTWQRLQLIGLDLPENCHIQFFTLSSNKKDNPGTLSRNVTPINSLGLAGDSKSLIPLDSWRAAPNDSADFLALNQPGHYLWLAGIFQGNGRDTPKIQQIRLTYENASWLSYMPALYCKDQDTRQLLSRMLTLFKSSLADMEAKIDDLPLLFDPLSAPDPWSGPDDEETEKETETLQPWLDWLAGWLDFDLDESWLEEFRRKALSRAFELYSRRGSVAGLKEMVKLYTDRMVQITEPVLFAHLWSLGDTSTLGFDTMMAPAHAQGVVVGTTATLNQSHLITEQDFGAPLFDDLAHHFCAQVVMADADIPGTNPAEILDKVRQVLDREKPAHTCYHLCALVPRLRVGFQAQIGIDTFIGSTHPGMFLGESQLGLDTALSESARRPEVRSAMEKDARLGKTTRLT